VAEQSNKENAAGIVATGRLQFANLKSILLLKEISSASATPIELTQDLVFFTIRESIYDKTLTGTITFNDIKNIFDLTPFTGTEFILVEIEGRRATFKRDMLFKVMSVVKSRPENQPFGTVSIEFADTTIITMLKEFSTSFSNTRISDFIHDFSVHNFGVTDDLLTIDETDGEFSFAFPYQKFVYMLKYLNKFAVSAETQGSYYYYFANLFYSGFTYRSLSTMLQQTSLYQFNEIYSNDIIMPDSFWQQERISKMDIKYMAVERGFGSTQFTLDKDNVPAINEAKYSTTIPELKGTGTYGYIAQLNLATSFNYYDANSNSREHKNKIIELAVRFADRVVIRCKGSIERMCGQKADIKFLNRTLPKGNYDLEKSGDYLIESVDHIFSKNTYEQLISVFRIGSNIKYSPNQVELV
jgi:hypothetical protein